MPLGDFSMFDAETTALLRTVLNEICENVSQYEAGTRTHVASKILEAATRGDTSADDLKRAGQRALCSAPTMWR
jgi:hypothetical protein